MEQNEERLMRCAAAHKANWAEPRGSAGGPWGLNGPGGGEGRRQPATTGSCPGRGAVIGPSRRVPGDPPTAWRPRSRGFPEAEGEPPRGRLRARRWFTMLSRGRSRSRRPGRALGRPPPRAQDGDDPQAALAAVGAGEDVAAREPPPHRRRGL